MPILQRQQSRARGEQLAVIGRVGAEEPGEEERDQQGEEEEQISGEEEP